MQGGCVSEIVTIYILKFLLNNDIQIFPNPASIVLNITVEEVGVYEIFDITGKKLLFGSVFAGINEIDVNNLQPACYFIKIINRSGSLVEKWVKE